MSRLNYNKRRVVVTGIGMVTPLGNDTNDTWANILKGKSGVSLISRYDTSGQKAKIAAEVKNFPAENFFTEKEKKHLDLYVQYGVAAAEMAFDDAALTIDDRNAHRVGVITGVGMGGIPVLEKYCATLAEKGERRVTPFLIPMVLPNMISGHISIRKGTRGPNLSLSTACAAGTHAIGEAFQKIAFGISDIMIAGGAEAVISPIVMSGFTAAKALSLDFSDPSGACRPFDKNRSGFVMAEGAGMLILEELVHAKNRGAKIYAEINGYGATSDAYHITSPPPNGVGAAQCMAMALNDSGMNITDIDYINAHGTSTQLNDKCETLAIKTVFKNHAKNLNISSTKSMTGHMLGGAGGLEAALTALTIKSGKIPGTINYHTPDPDCDLDYVPNITREKKIRAAISNTFGFGGTNGVIVMKHFA